MQLSKKQTSMSRKAIMKARSKKEAPHRFLIDQMRATREINRRSVLVEAKILHNWGKMLHLAVKVFR